VHDHAKRHRGGDIVMRLLIGLFSPPTGTYGGLTRGLAVAGAARGRGHHVVFAASGAIVAALRERGERVHELPAPTILGLPEPVSRRIGQRSQRARLPVPEGRSVGNIWAVLAFSGLASRRYLHTATRAYLQVIAAAGPDVLFTDLDPVTVLAGQITGLPTAITYASVMERGRGSPPWRALRHAANTVLREHGQALFDPHRLYFGARVAKIIPSVPQLDDADPTRPDVTYTGPLIAGLHPSQPSPGDDRGRMVYVYVGTGSLPLPRLRRVLPAVFPAGGPVTCLVGAPSLSRPERAGAVEFRPYVPAGDILPTTDWTICHGGQNTIAQSLLHHVPLLIFPGPIFERRYNAAKTQAAGAGQLCELSDFAPDRLQALLGHRDRYTAGAAALGQALRASSGPNGAIDVLEQHAASARATP
jgi:UDP:flavonoid glycosyltransferase YjiC (YdhE family)